MFHFVYEGIVAPSLRSHVRFQLFGVRDQLRHLADYNPSELSAQVYHELESSINATVAFLPRIDLATTLKLQRALESDDALRKRLARRRKVVDDCLLAEVREVREKTVHLTTTALLINSGAWFPYLIPLAVLLATFQRMKRMIRYFTVLDERDMEQISPHPTLAPSH